MAMAVPAAAPTLMLNWTRFIHSPLLDLFDRPLYDLVCFQFNDEEALSKIDVFQYVLQNEGKEVLSEKNCAV